jgi:hypothetical protein
MQNYLNSQNTYHPTRRQVFNSKAWHWKWESFSAVFEMLIISTYQE